MLRQFAPNQGKNAFLAHNEWIKPPCLYALNRSIESSQRAPPGPFAKRGKNMEEKILVDNFEVNKNVLYLVYFV